MQSQWEEQFEGAAKRAVQAVIDLDSSERECPACGKRLAAGPTKCADCGLFIGG